jgi:tRNA1Val (adenine37-N6)-methyltransferase
MGAAKDEPRDSILGGGLTVIQPRRGYRFSVEAILLARFVRPRAGARILELGAGCGVVALIIAALLAAASVRERKGVYSEEARKHLGIPEAKPLQRS